MSKVSHKREYPIRRPKERPRNLELELLKEQLRQEKLKERETRIIGKVIHSKDTVS